MAWLSTWSHRKTITITGGTGAGTNYQVNLSIGDASGGDFHLENNCTSFPNDITVTDNDQTTLLDHWVEDLTVDPISMWVELADDLGSNVDVCVYYNKSGESSASNGANTFIQYHGSATATYLDSLVTVADSDLYYRSRIMIANSGSEVSNIIVGIANTATGTDDCIFIQSYTISPYNYPNSRRYAGATNEGPVTKIEEHPHFADNNYHICELKFLAGASLYGYVDDNQISTNIVTNLPAGESMGLWLWELTGSVTQTWSFIAKYNDPVPAFSSASAEESAPVAGHPTMARWHGIPGMNYTGRAGASW